MSKNTYNITEVSQSSPYDISIVQASSTKNCPFCAEDILIDAIKCKHCGEWLNIPKISTENQFSNKQNLTVLFLLSFLTIGIYDIFWFYKNWKHFKTIGYKLSPGLRTFGLFIPILNLYLIDNFIREVKKIGDSVGVKTYQNPSLINILYLISNIASRYFVVHLGFWAPLYLQSKLNSYWDKTQPELRLKSSPSLGELFLIILLGLCWLLVLLSVAVNKTI